MPAIQQPTPNAQVCFSNLNGIIDAVISVKQFPALSQFIRVGHKPKDDDHCHQQIQLLICAYLD